MICKDAVKFSETSLHKIKFNKKKISIGVVSEIKENHKKILQVPERCETFERKENFDFLEVPSRYLYSCWQCGEGQ